LEERGKGQKIVRVIEGLVEGRIGLLKEKMEKEKYEQTVVEQAQRHAIARM
jgi:hypothetical protein